MKRALRIRLTLGIAYYAATIWVLSWHPILGVSLALLPIFWSVLVVFIGSEAGMGYGRYHLHRETVFATIVRRVWALSRFGKVALSVVGLGLVFAGLAWISTERLRAERAEPTFTERAIGAAEEVQDTTSNTVREWWDTTKSWFRTSGADHSP